MKSHNKISIDLFNLFYSIFAILITRYIQFQTAIFHPLPLPPRVDIPPSTNLDLAPRSRPVARQKPRQEIIVHEILLPLSPLLIQRLSVLPLILGQDQILSPVILAAHMLGQSAIGAAMNRLRHAKHISSSVPLEALLEVDLEVSVLVRRAACSGEGALAALGAELLVHVLCDVEAAVAAQHPRLEICDAGHGRRDEVEVDAQCDVLHGVIGG